MWLSRTVKAPISVIVIGDLYIRDLEVTFKGQPRSKIVADSERADVKFTNSVS